MNKTKLLSKIALYISAAAFLFTALSAICTYILIGIVNTGVTIPAEYYAFNILNVILPYLLLAVSALIVSALTRSAQETPAKEDDGSIPPEETSANEIEKTFNEETA
ncbi:MAG: hypothetical protein NWE93_12805 [Candidatus Bathyarchaeota archaeon]|nr:hypothetical protein [Candidatus Bathyarchaeota archaeon]